MVDFVVVSTIAIRERLGGTPIQDALRVDESVALVSRSGVKRVGPCVLVDTVGLVDPPRPQAVEGTVQLEEGVLVEDSVIEFGSPFDHVARETADFTLGLCGEGLVPVILRSARTEVKNVISLSQFVFEIAEIVSAQWIEWRLGGSAEVNHRVRIEEQDAFLEMMEGLVQK